MFKFTVSEEWVMVRCRGSKGSTFELCWELNLSRLTVVRSLELGSGPITSLSVCLVLANVWQTK